MQTSLGHRSFSGSMACYKICLISSKVESIEWRYAVGDMFKYYSIVHSIPHIDSFLKIKIFLLSVSLINVSIRPISLTTLFWVIWKPLLSAETAQISINLLNNLMPSLSWGPNILENLPELVYKNCPVVRTPSTSRIRFLIFVVFFISGVSRLVFLGRYRELSCLKVIYLGYIPKWYL